MYYFIQGLFFLDDPSKKMDWNVEDMIGTFGEDPFYHGLIYPHDRVGLPVGVMIDAHGKSVLSEVVHDDKFLSFKKTYEERTRGQIHEFFYVFDTKKGNVWTGRWEQEWKEKKYTGTSRCAIVRVNEDFFLPNRRP